MTDSAEEMLANLPDEEAFKIADREVSRRFDEQKLISTLQDFLEIAEIPNHNSNEYKSRLYAFKDRLNSLSLAWQDQDSGTIGELITRWQGRGFLEGFPDFRPFKDGDAESIDVKRRKDGKFLLDARVSFFTRFQETGPHWLAHWKFLVSPLDLEQRGKQVEDDLGKWRKITDELSSSPEDW